MSTKLADAYPRKHFFLEIFTRDISLEDCILDLIDNSIDGVVRTRKIDISSTLLLQNNDAPSADLPKIEVTYSEKHFEIKDTCGGIPKDHALKDVFTFGHSPGAMAGLLGVYGVGLKRAIFKIGENFEMRSRTMEDGFDVNLDVRAWSEKDKKLEDWKIPISIVAGVNSAKKAGTAIRITKLRREVMMRITDGTFAERLRGVISQTYGLFIGRYVRIFVNGSEVSAFQIPLGASAEVTPARETFEENGVRVELFASLAERTGEKWRSEPAGWYVLCNGRIVVAADKTELTGWGPGFIQFHEGKHRGFVGVAFFNATDPVLLPWTTTKRGLNRESPVYQVARNRMKGIARPITSFLDSMYKSEVPEEQVERDVADQVRSISLASVAASPPSVFTLNLRKRPPKTTTRVQYDAEKVDIERIKRHIKKYSWGANQVGRHTFEFYLENECPE